MLEYQFLWSSSLAEKINVATKLGNSISGKVEVKVKPTDLVIHYGSNNSNFMQVCVC